MTEPEAVIWGVRAGETGQADSFFLKKNCIAIGWTRMGDLSAFPPDREVIKGKLAAAYPDSKPMGVALEAGMLLRFLHEMLVTLGTFTNQAKGFAHSKSNLRLIDGGELVALILSHYEQFDSRYKGLLPLKQVYVPDSEPVESEME